MQNDRVTRSVKRLYASAENAYAVNARNLCEVLAANAGTVLGRRVGLSSVENAADWARTMPLTEYAFYEEYVRRAAEGEKNVLTAEDACAFLYTSGTMGKRKILPLCETALSRYGSCICDMPFYLTGTCGGAHLHTSVFTPPDERGGQLLSSAYFGYLYRSGQTEGRYLGGERLNFAGDISAVPYVKLRMALACAELCSIQSIFLYDTLLFFSYLGEHWQTLLRDLRDGCVSAELSADAKEALCATSRPTRERLAELERILSRGDLSQIAQKLWRGLRFVSGIGGGEHTWQTETLRKYIGDTPVCYFTYTSSEVMAGATVRMDSAEYVLMPESAYYEFLPLGSDETVAMEDVAIGECYEPVVTTFSGLYRYRTGDILRITGRLGQAPLFEVAGRVGRFLNVAGEKLDESTIAEAVRMLAADGTEIRDFTVCTAERSIPGHYVFFLEAESDAAHCSRFLDAALHTLSRDYAELRALGMIAPPEVVLCEKFAIDAALHAGGPSHRKEGVVAGEAVYRALMERTQGGRREE